MSKMVNSRPRSMDNGRQTGSAPDQSLLLDAALQAVNWRKRQILCFVAVAFALALLLIHNSTPRYTATAGLITETSRATPSPADRGPEGVIDNTIIESQTAIIKSDSVALAVIDKLKLWEDPEFVGPGGGSLSRIAGALGFYRAPIGKADKNDGIRKQSALEGFQRALNVTRVGRSYVVEVSFTSNDFGKVRKNRKRGGRGLYQRSAEREARRKPAGCRVDAAAPSRFAHKRRQRKTRPTDAQTRGGFERR